MMELTIINWAKEAVEKAKEDIKYYVKEGLSLQTAFDLVLKPSVLGNKYKQEVLDYFN